MQPPFPTSEPRATPASHRLAAKLLSLLSARWLHEVLQFFLFIYLARSSATTYGIFQLAFSLGSIYLLVGEFGLNLPLVGLLSRPTADPRQTLSQVLTLKTGALILAGAGVVVFVSLQHYPSPLLEVALVICGGMGLEALASTFFTTLQVQGRQGLEGRIRAAAALLGFGYALTALALGAPTLAVALFKSLEALVNLLGSVAAVGLGGFWRLPSLQGLRRTCRGVVVFALMEAAAIVYNKANVFFLERQQGPQGVAQYSAAWSIVDGVSTLATTLVLQSILFPLFARYWEADRREVARLSHASARWLLGAALLLMFFLYLESDRLIPWLYGPEFAEAVWLQRWLVITIFFAFVHNLSGFLMISMGRQGVLAAFYLVGLSFNLLFCWLVIPRAPLLGTALAIILTKGGIALMSFTFTQRRLQFLPLRDLGQLAGTALLGFLWVYLGTPIFSRTTASIMAFSLMLALLVYWWHFKYPRVGGEGAQGS
jgi:O-antigen/teichoic acid export membrane protein